MISVLQRSADGLRYEVIYYLNSSEGYTFGLPEGAQLAYANFATIDRALRFVRSVCYKEDCALIL